MIMIGEEFYNKYKGKTVVNFDGRKGIVVGYGIEGNFDAFGIISITSNIPGWEFSDNTRSKIFLYNNRYDNPKGYWCVSEGTIVKVYSNIKFGR